MLSLSPPVLLGAPCSRALLPWVSNSLTTLRWDELCHTLPHIALCCLLASPGTLGTAQNTCRMIQCLLACFAVMLLATAVLFHANSRVQTASISAQASVQWSTMGTAWMLWLLRPLQRQTDSSKIPCLSLQDRPITKEVVTYVQEHRPIAKQVPPASASCAAATISGRICRNDVVYAYHCPLCVQGIRQSCPQTTCSHTFPFACLSL